MKDLQFIKKSVLFVLMGVLALSLPMACGDEPAGPGDGGGNGGGNVSTITATNVIDYNTGLPPKGIATVKVWGYSEEALAEAPYKNNGFTLELPATLPDENLGTVGNELWNNGWMDSTDSIPDGIVMSDKNAKGVMPWQIYGYDADENRIGNFYYDFESDDTYCECYWFYVDRNVTVKGLAIPSGVSDEEDYYDLDLKKGWNVIYIFDSVDNNRTTWTSKKPSGIEFAWYFEEDSDFMSAQVAKSAASQKSFISKFKVNKIRE